MRNFLATLFITGVAVQASADYTKCADTLVKSSNLSQSTNCAGKSSQACFCANQDAIDALSSAAAKACSSIGQDMSTISSSLCSSSNKKETGLRQATNPMEPGSGFGTDSFKRAYAPEAPAAPRTLYVTETVTQCSCKNTPMPNMMPAVSQISVQVPTSSSQMGLAGWATPASSSMGVMVGAPSSSVFGVQSATPMPSGASANRYNAFKGAAPAASSVHGGAVFGVAAVMALMVAL